MPATAPPQQHAPRHAPNHPGTQLGGARGSGVNTAPVTPTPDPTPAPLEVVSIEAKATGAANDSGQALVVTRPWLGPLLALRIE